MKWAVPKLWPGETFVLIGGGPSLTQADVDACRGLRTVVVNDGYRKAPWANVLYVADAKWWTYTNRDTGRTHLESTRDFAGLKVSPGWVHKHQHGRVERVQQKGPSTKTGRKWPSDIHLVETTIRTGLEMKPTGLAHGGNGGYQAINLAVHLGAKRILLLGYDMKRGKTGSHWFGEHSTGGFPPLSTWVPTFSALVQPLKALGVEILNCSRETALGCFTRVPLERALAREVAA